MSKERRTGIVRSAEFQTREENGSRYIEGYFALYNSEYWVSQNAYETIDPGAFHLERDTDVRALTNHDSTLVLGRTSSGTLQLRSDENGLWGSVLINERDQDAVNAYERVRRGDVSQCSFGFCILDENIEHRADGYTIWHLRDIELHEVSICTFPAYKDTEVEARTAELDRMARRELKAWRAEALARVKGESPKEV